MLKNKTQVIIIGALAVTFLMNFQRLIIAIIDDNEIATAFGLTIEILLMRMVIMFAYSWVLLSFNILWKDGGEIASLSTRVVNVTINFGILAAGIISTTAIKINFISVPIENKKLLISTVINYLVVHPILLLLARFIKLSFQQRQNILEKQKAKQKALQHQLEALRTQINPHFLFNALNSLTVLIRQKSDRALSFVDQLSWLLRSTLRQSEEDFITIQEELDYLESYLFLQRERFGEKFKVAIQIPENWKKELIPSFSLQLLAENAIKHNIISSKQPLLLEIYSNEEYLIVRNQIQKRRDATEGPGTGLLNLSIRFKLLKKRDIQINQDENYFTVKLPIITP
ncbi:MAG: histidine kinase [Bacteroidota bacterium]